jgi:hypothetical protein
MRNLLIFLDMGIRLTQVTAIGSVATHERGNLFLPGSKFPTYARCAGIGSSIITGT